MHFQKIEVGDRVRAFDFEDDDTHYVEGVVEGVVTEGEDCPRYKLKMERRVSRGVELPYSWKDDPYVYPPVNGTETRRGGYTNYVIRVCREAV